jgi:hypothetical protein
MRYGIVLWMIIIVVAAIPRLCAADASQLSVSASFWDYGSLCSPKAPLDEPLTLKALSNDVKIGWKECAALEKQWGKPAAVRLRLINQGADEAEVIMPALSSVLLRGAAGEHSALGMLLRTLDTAGSATLAPVTDFKGSLAFPVQAKKAIDLVLFFQQAYKGDALAFGELSSVTVEGEPPQTIAPQPPLLKTAAWLWAGDVCDESLKKPRSLTFKGSFEMGACSASGQVVHVEIANSGGQEAMVTLRGLDSLRLSRPKGGSIVSTGLALTMPNPIGRGTQTSMVTKIEGEIGFPVGGGAAFDLLILFPKAAVGDTVTVADAPPAVIRP